MIHDFVIIGGGVAGLSAAIHLAERGAKPLLVEAGTYPAHKICGEFFSPETLPILERWGINPPVMLHTVIFHAGAPFETLRSSGRAPCEKDFSFTLPTPAGSMPRYDFDAQLAAYAQKLGVVVLTNTSVTDIHIQKEALALRNESMKWTSVSKGAPDNSGPYQLMLSSGQEIVARSVIIGTGRALGLIKNQKNLALKKSVPKYFGIKAHIKHQDLGDSVQFFSFPGAYLGISSVGNGVTNLACLANIDVVKKFPSTELFMRDLAAQSNNQQLQDLLSQGMRLFPDWMTCYAPEFGVKDFPDMPNLYVIGDAAGTIPPASGDGLGIAITSGQLLAQYALNHDALGFKKAWKYRYGPIIKTGKLLHMIMMRPIFAKLVITLCAWAPNIAKKLFIKTRYNKTN